MTTPHPAAAPAQTALLAEIQAEVDRLLVAVHRHKVPEGECAFCDRERAANNNFHPAHDASERCENCSCDTCF